MNFTHLNKEGKPTMVGVSKKLSTLRTAQASCFLRMNSAAIQALKDKALPKGDALVVAQVAGIQAAKWTAHLIPLCHSLEARQIDVQLEIEDQGVHVRSYVETVAPTGPEMEALTACTIAGLALYDMCKAVDKSMALEAVRLEKKTGGKSDLHLEELKGRRAALLTLSDRASQGIYEDKSGPTAASALKQAGLEIIFQEIIPDEEKLVTRKLKELCDGLKPDLIFTLGSTGLSPRDVAPEAIQKIIERTVPGIPEIIRNQFFAQHPTSTFLSRSMAGLRGKTLIVNLPGRPSAITEALSVIIPALPHVFQMIAGQGH